MSNAVNRAILAWVPRVMFVLMPLFAWFAAAAVSKTVDLAAAPAREPLELLTKPPA